MGPGVPLAWKPNLICMGKLTVPVGQGQGQGQGDWRNQFVLSLLQPASICRLSLFRAYLVVSRFAIPTWSPSHSP